MVRSHFVPRFYLKGFCGPNEKLWCYKKGTDKRYSAAVEKAAVEKGLYPNALEEVLNNQIEQPAKSGLLKIRDRQVIDPVEKTALSAYIVSQWKRTPKTLEWMQRNAPEITEKAWEAQEACYNELLQFHPKWRNYLESRREQELKTLENYKSGLPKEIWHSALEPDTNHRAISVINSLRWHIYTYDNPEFLTSDSPVVFIGGLGHHDGLMSFAVSSHIAIEADWLFMGQDMAYFTATQTVIHRINQRTADSARVSVYFNRDSELLANNMLQYKT